MNSTSTPNEPTLYPSAYMVLNNKGYTNVTEVESRASSPALPRCSNVTERKHYYAGTERVAARLGGGGLNALQPVVAIDDELQWKADKLFKQSLDHVNHRVLGENDLNCIMRNKFSPEVLGEWIDGIPYQVRADVETEYWQFKDMVHSMLVDLNNGQEKEVYFYHSDHLGSASWITDFSGMAVQHIQYLPYGEPYINQRPFGYSERFTFTGKERDEETGYGYFGARYMDHELMTMWLSVDPMADKYPSISPYAYCHWNPIKLVDPDGQEDYQVDNNGNITKCKDQSHAVEGKDRLFRGRPKFDKNGQPKKSYVDATEGTFGEYNEETNRGITKYNLNYEDLDDNQVPYSPCEIKINEGSSDASERKATEIFEFLSKNTRVEWTYFGLGSPESDELQSVRITTSRMRGYEPYGFGRARRWKEWVKFAYHPHKNAQGASKDGYDDKLPELVPNATLGIYHTWSGTYVDFDGNRIAGPKR